jgi:hypothetical protein
MLPDESGGWYDFLFITRADTVSASMLIRDHIQCLVAMAASTSKVGLERVCVL